MLIKTIIYFLIIILPLMELSKTYAKEELSSFSLEEQKKLLNGEILVQTQEIAGRPWPQLDLFAVLPHLTALEALAIYADFEHQKDYVPQMIESTPEKEISPRSVLVSYSLNMPWPIPNLVYKTLNTLSKEVGEGQIEIYCLEWKQVLSNQTKMSEGKIRFIPLQNNNINKILVHYTNRVEPTSMLAPLLRSKFISDTQETIQTIFKYMLSVKQEKKDYLNERLEKVKLMFK